MLVKVRNSMWERRSAYFFPIAEFNIWQGDEVKVKWVKPHQLALSTGLKDFEFRVIERALIVSIDGLPYAYEGARPPVQERERLVEGSKGQIYRVTSSSCTCPGFTFRGACKHVTG